MKTLLPLPATSPLYERINQAGVGPGARKLAQFREALTLRETPAFGITEGQGGKALARVKLFDPCGSYTAWITEWDGGSTAFGFVTGLGFDEWGYIDIAEVAQTGGRFGIGIEIDVHFLPQPLETAVKPIILP